MNRKLLIGIRTSILLTALAVSTLEVAGADWPCFLGSKHNGVSAETGLARSWPESGPRVLWTLPLGEGYGAASVRAGKVYVLDRVDSKSDVLRVHDLESGAEEWTFSYEAPGKMSFNGSRSVPALTDRFVYTVGAMGDVYCLDIGTHEVVWRRHLMKDFSEAEEKFPMWGVAGSPYLYKGSVLLTLPYRWAGLVALDQKTGRTQWISPSDPNEEPGLDHGNYMTPNVVTLGGVDQVILCSGEERNQTTQEIKGRVMGLSLEDGRVLWSFKSGTGHIATPIAAGPNRALLTASYPAQTLLLEVTRSGEEFDTREIFRHPDCGAQMHVPIIHEGHIYLNGNGNKKRDGLVCLSLEGKMLWQTIDSRELPGAISGLPGFDRGCMIAADGMFLAIDGVKGSLHLIEPSPEAYKELARANLLEGKDIWAPMALSDGRLLIRDKKQMKCVDVLKPAASE